jgi:hypothetical protein
MLSHLRHELLHVVHARPLVLPPSAAIVTQFVTRLQARGQTDHLLVSEPKTVSALLCASSGGPGPSLEVRYGSPLCGSEVAQLVARTAGGDTKTKKSRRTLAMPQRCVAALTALWDSRTCGHADRTQCDCLVFVSQAGTPLDAHNVRRSFRKVATMAGLTAKDWTLRELRHSFVSLLSDDGMPIEQIARLVGHTSTAVTETVYRQQIRPVIIEGAEAMDRIFSADIPRNSA